MGAPPLNLQPGYQDENNVILWYNVNTYFVVAVVVVVFFCFVLFVLVFCFFLVLVCLFFSFLCLRANP